jgi:hypothetical protein
MKMEVKGGTVIGDLGAFGRVMAYRIDEDDVGMIMDIIANKTYSQKQLAVVREYICNAWDAHVEAGCTDKPFLVTAPTELDPTFKVRDYGLGMSIDKVENVYVRMAKSTKRDSNDSIGSYGIGAKSAFCYGDSFLVSSFHDGKVSRYLAQIDERKRAHMVHMSTEPSDESSGVEISVSVRTEDINLFKELIADVCRNFPTLPVVENVDKDSLVPPSKDVVGTGWFMTKGGDSRGCVALCGNVEYTIDLYKVFSGRFDSSIFGFNNTLTFIFDLGEVDIPPSRETLEYTPKTISAVAKKIERFKSEVFANAQDGIEKAKDVFEAMRIAGEFSGSSFGGLKYKTAKISELRTFDYRTHCVEAKFIDACNKKIFPPVKYYRPIDILAAKPLIILADDYKNIRRKTLKIGMENSASAVLIVDTKNESFAKVKDTLALDHYPKSHVFKASDIVVEKIKRIKRATVDRSTYYKVMPNGVRKISVDDLPLGKKYWVGVERGKLISNRYRIQSIIGYNPQFPLYATRISDWQSLDKNEWMSLTDYAKTFLSDEAKKFTEEELSLINESSESKVDILLDLPEFSELNRLKKQKIASERKFEKISGIAHFARVTGVTEASKFFCNKGLIQAEMRKIFARYPMIKYFEYTIDKSKKSDIMAYIELVNKSNKGEKQ